MRTLALLLALAVALPCGAQSAQSSRPPQTARPAPSAQTAPAAAAATTGELLPDEQIQQALNRLTFGPRPGDAARVRQMGLDRWIDLQLHPERVDDSRANRLVSQYPVLTMKTSDVVRDYTAAQRLQREVARVAGADSSITRQEARRQVLAQKPELAGITGQARRFVGEVQSAKLARAVASERQLDEVMVDFWENHFSVFSGKGQTRLFLAQYDRDVIRPHALGKFRDLLGAVAKSPAMLFFLDNWQSAADSTQPTLANRNGGRPRVGRRTLRPGIVARRPVIGAGVNGLPPAARERLENATPEERAQIMQRLQQRAQRARRGLNENYARELMELHTLGVDGGYTQKDVQEVARALTGWTFNRQTGQFLFNPRVHDAGEKIILGHTFAAGHGQEEGEQVLDLLARASATAHFVTTKLARRFVSDDPPAALVDRCAGRFSATDGDIRETLRCIVTSHEFFSRAAYRAKVKTPFELVVSSLRALGAQPDTTPRTAQLVARLGQPIFGRQTPDGWPDHGDAWMNTGAILNRINFGLSLAAGQVPGVRLSSWSEYDALRSLPREQQVDGVVAAILGGQVSPETRAILISGDNPMLSVPRASDINGMAVADPDAAGATMDARRGRGRAGRPTARNAGGKGVPRGRGAQLRGYGRPVNLQGLAQVVGLALGAPEFQRR